MNRETLEGWPSEHPRPAASVLYEWLNRAFEEKRVRRHSTGVRSDPSMLDFAARQLDDW